MKVVKAVFWGILGGGSVVLLSGCISDNELKEKLQRVLAEDPTPVTNSIEHHSLAYMTSLQNAAQKAQQEIVQKQRQAEEEELKDYYKNPLNPKIRKDENIRGPENAPHTLVMYADFECHFCSKGADTVKELFEDSKIGPNLRYVYKHYPLDFHQQADVASRYYEAIRLQSAKLAWKFHDVVFKNQDELRNKGEEFLKKQAKKLKVNMIRLAKDIHSEKVKNRIEEDRKEAEEFGFMGTPGFVFNGIPAKGAYPASHFREIAKKLKERKE